MAYDEAFAGRIRRALGPRPDVTERRMFGGIAFMTGGNMFVGVAGNELMIRAGKEAHAEMLARPGVRPMDFTGRPMAGYVFVSAEGTATDSALADWIEHAYRFASSPKLLLVLGVQGQVAVSCGDVVAGGTTAKR